MSLPFLIDFPKSQYGGIQTGMSAWALHHRIDHQDVADAVRAQFGIDLPQYEIDPMSFTKDSLFLLRNQQMHNDCNSVLGTSGVDLSALDFSDASQIQAWLWLHFEAHRAWHEVLRI